MHPEHFNSISQYNDLDRRRNPFRRRCRNSRRRRRLQCRHLRRASQIAFSIIDVKQNQFSFHFKSFASDSSKTSRYMY